MKGGKESLGRSKGKDAAEQGYRVSLGIGVGDQVGRGRIACREKEEKVMYGPHHPSSDS